jgi:hypothetical protein
MCVKRDRERMSMAKKKKIVKFPRPCGISELKVDVGGNRLKKNSKPYFLLLLQNEVYLLFLIFYFLI